MPTKEFKVLFFGDIVGKPGRKALAAVLPELKKTYQPTVVIANAENLGHGVGVTRKTLEECQHAGVDLFTSGNHIWKKPEVYEIFEKGDVPLIRPANFPGDQPGSGHTVISLGSYALLVINLNGQVFIDEQFENPFHAFDHIIGMYSPGDLNGIIVDLHAEATSEKVAFGWHADGRASAVLGTHTHIPTADTALLPNGTAYQTDVGMVGLKESVIGVDKDIVLNNFTKETQRSHDIPDHGACIVNGTLVTINPATRYAEAIERVYREATV
ncbi:MAG: TIGR00282 family metallophosphoesterase [Patescibacteria group bacterium]|nr:TIGR00282 family metallophosphoesterase [Patescibacteria group bacterium]MDD5715524.1 TIGR00282 family metallophosphoesterase [Patescibacteria group bacterium]